MIRLSEFPRRASLIAFWLVVTVSLGVVIALFLSIFVGKLAIFLSVLVSFLMWTTGFYNLGLVKKFYTGWDMCAKKLSRAVSKASMLSTHLLINYYGKLLQSDFRDSLKPTHAQDMWSAKTTQSPESYSSTWFSGSVHSSDSWIRDLLYWSIHTRNLWVLALMPNLVLLELLKSNERTPSYNNIYTLF